VSEGGSNVFPVTYFDKKVYLAQSPQLYKQIAINGGLERVFEFGPVFRAENALTYRHLCEFISFDIEMVIKTDHYELVAFIWNILYEAFKKLEERESYMIDFILEKTKTEHLKFPQNPLFIDFRDGVELLKQNNIDQDSLDDIGTVNEKILGKIIKDKYDSDVYCLINYPSACRPFYTMKHDDDPQYSKSFDIMFRCNEISSGSQRNHDYNILMESVLAKGIKIEGSGLEKYLESFRHGTLSHGGCGIGLERIVMLYLGLQNVRDCSMFPRDPKTVEP
jgi:aspartyl-tRNA synthetase